MAAINLIKLTISEAKNLIHSGGISARELLEMHYSEINKSNKKLNVYLEVFEDEFEKAKDSDVRIKHGNEPRALEGIPIAIKDNILIKGKIVSAASKILEMYIASYDAYVVTKLREAGAVFVGRTNMDEFAMGSSTENSAFGVTKNPHDDLRVPGGSSGGSAAAVASGMALAAIGSDTGGSIRQPAAFCGVVGLKPTYGAVSRSGLIAMASSLDQIGPITKNVEDAELIFGIISGRDEKDATSVNFQKKNTPTNLVIGIPKEFGRERGGVDADMLEKFNEARQVFEEHGYEVRGISLPHASYALAVYYIIMPAEVSSNLARFDGIRYGLSVKSKDLLGTYIKTRAEGFGKEARRRIILGTYVLSAGYYEAYYSRAEKVRELIFLDFKNAFKEVDAIMSLTTPTPAFKIGEKTSDPLSMYMSDIFTVPANIAGIPAISVPFGFVNRKGKNLPVGIQFMAPWFSESTLFKLGKFLESYA